MAEEQALVRRLVTMDERAWEMFCHEYSGPLFAFVHMGLGCSPEQAEDIVQMTFSRCVRSIGTFDAARGRLSSWLKTVARNEAHTCLRKEVGDRAHVPLSSVPPHVAEQLLYALDTRPLPDELLAREDLQMAVRSALSKINARHREALIGKYIEGMSVKEIASEMGISEKAVESILSRSRAALRDVLMEGTPGRASPTIEMPNGRA